MRTPVVTAFVYQGGRIALMKRSDRVGTYSGAWAAFSGYAERLPLNAAWQELSEEAGISRPDAQLTGIGVPLEIDDSDEGRCWLVLPFLFRLMDGVEIKTDWEAAEWGWYAPEEIAGMRTVPGLAEALDRVWPPFGDREFWNGLAEVATDTTHGATELARRGLAALGGFVQANYDSLDSAGLLRAVRAFASSRAVMGVFPNLAARLLLAIEREGGQFDFDVLVTELLSAVEDTTALSADAAAEALKGKDRLFTLSYSEAVRDAVVRWSSPDSRVSVAESGPREEGILLAEYLSGHGVCAHTVRDVEIEAAIRDSDAVLVGCDAITRTDEVLNKAGTRTAVTAAANAGIPSYAIAQTFKITPPQWPVFLERQAPADLYEALESQVGDPVFDLTPLDRFEAVFTEEGRLTPERLSEIRSELDSVELIPRS